MGQSLNMQTSFSDPRIKEYMDDGGAKYNEELSQFLAGIAVLSVHVHGTVDVSQTSMLYNMSRGMSIHEAAFEEYDFLRRQVMG